MKTQHSFIPVAVVELAETSNKLHGWRIPGKSKVVAFCQLAIFAVLLSPVISASADEDLPPMQGSAMEHGRHFDWLMHTQRTLDELKGKLNLAPAQLAGWNTWSRGVLDDSKQQLGHKKNEHDQKQLESKVSADETTPEKMARGIERLKSETAWMQEHLAQLEAAQIRTSAFYATLDTNQKTIFDLFWHELYHRISGHDQSGGVPVSRTSLTIS